MTLERRVATIPRDRRVPPAARAVARLFLYLPPSLRGFVWRRIPRSRLQRAALTSVVRASYERFNEAGSFPTAFVSREVVAHQASELLDSVGTFHGHAGLEAMLEELRHAWGALTFDPEEIFELGDRAGVVVVVRASNRGDRSGVATERRVAHVMEVRAGSVVRFDVYWDPAEALRLLA